MFNGHDGPTTPYPGDPTEIGGYRVPRRSGHGGMGTVYLAAAPSGRQVALKIVHPDLAEDPSFRQRFDRAVETARSVARFSTAGVIDVQVLEGYDYLTVGLRCARDLYPAEAEPDDAEPDEDDFAVNPTTDTFSARPRDTTAPPRSEHVPVPGAARELPGRTDPRRVTVDPSPHVPSDPVPLTGRTVSPPAGSHPTETRRGADIGTLIGAYHTICEDPRL